MLKHEDNSETDKFKILSRPAAQVRVTPEELAAAITRLEARKEAGQRDLEGTIPIGEAVQQLGLEATPEEVLAEIQAGRTEQSTKQKGQLSLQRQRLRLRQAIAVAVAGMGALWTISHFSGDFSPDAVTPATVSAPAAVVSDNAGSKPPHISLDPNLLVGEQSGKVVMLSEVGDNQPVHCTLDGNPLAFGPYSPSSPQTTWTLIKHGGKVYVRGRVEAMSAKALARDGADILSPDPNVSADGLVVPITLSVDGFEATLIMDTMFHAQNIHLDKHAYEKWQP